MLRIQSGTSSYPIPVLLSRKELIFFYLAKLNCFTDTNRAHKYSRVASIKISTRLVSAVFPKIVGSPDLWHLPYSAGEFSDVQRGTFTHDVALFKKGNTMSELMEYTTMNGCIPIKQYPHLQRKSLNICFNVIVVVPYVLLKTELIVLTYFHRRQSLDGSIVLLICRSFIFRNELVICIWWGVTFNPVTFLFAVLNNDN